MCLKLGRVAMEGSRPSASSPIKRCRTPISAAAGAAERRGGGQHAISVS